MPNLAVIAMTILVLTWVGSLSAQVDVKAPRRVAPSPALRVSAAHPILSKIVRCRPQVEAQLKTLRVRGEWEIQGPAPEGEVFRSPTQDIGRWVELVVSSDGRAVIFDAQLKSTKRIDFNEPCKARMRTQKGMDFSASHPDRKARYFTDESLKVLLKKHKRGIIYTWSPGMAYSMAHLTDFQSVSKELKIEFIPLMDPRATRSKAPENRRIAGIPVNPVKLNSVELYMRNLTLHFPSVVVFSKGKLHPSIIVGVYDKERLKAEITNRLGAAL